MPNVLTIAGSDPSGGAGIQADIKVFQALGVRGLSAITAITAQTEKMVLGIHPVAPDILTQQLSSAMKECELNAVKIGMIGNAANIRAIILFLHSAKIPHIVIDPVFNATSGAPLLETHALKLFKDGLLPLATVITPNMDEAGALTGMRLWNIGTMKEAAQEIHDEAYQLKNDKARELYVLVKGGHLKGEATDILYDGAKFHEFPGRHIAGAGRHGTGCVLSSAIAANLSRGKPIIESVTMAKKFVEDYIKRSGAD